jgi:molybdate-binding protein
MALPLILGAVGGAAKLVGAFGKKSEAERQLDAQRVYAQQQRSTFNTGYGDLLSQAKSAATYQGDISRFQKVEQQADLAKRMASGQSRGAGEQIARDQAAQTSANVLAAATRGAGSGTDIMTAALLSQQGENQAQNAISARSAEEQRAAKAAAMAQEFAAFGNTAAAAARERGLEFSSLANKQANIMGVTQNKMEGEMNLNQSLFDQEQAKAAALEEARGAIWSGIGDIASGVSSGMMGMANQKAQMSMLNKIYGGGSTGGDVLTGARAFASNAIGSGASLAKMISPSFGQMQQLPTSKIKLPQAPVYSSGYDGLGNSITPFF